MSSKHLGLTIVAIIGALSLLRLQLTVWNPYPIGWLFFAAYLVFASIRLRGLATRT